jgi:hypothetical protein
VARRLGWPTGAVRWRRRALGLQRRDARAWTPAEDQALGRAWPRGGDELARPALGALTRGAAPAGRQARPDPTATAAPLAARRGPPAAHRLRARADLRHDSTPSTASTSTPRRHRSSTPHGNYRTNKSCGGPSVRAGGRSQLPGE